jgi:hypothetical protein
LLKDDLLGSVDLLLDDPQLLELVRHCLVARCPASTRTGRTGIAPDRLLRSCVLKHLKGWSFRELERELRSNLIHRRFTHFDAEATPDFATFSRTFALLGPSITKKIHQRVVSLEGVAEGHQLSEEFERSHFAGLSEKTVRGHRSYLNNLKTFFANCTLDKITVEMVETYRDQRRQQPAKRRPSQTLKGATVNRELECLRCVLDLAVKRKYIPENQLQG